VRRAAWAEVWHSLSQRRASRFIRRDEVLIWLICRQQLFGYAATIPTAATWIVFFRGWKNDGISLDLLVNSAWGGYERMSENGEFTWTLPFWQQPMHRWNSKMRTGVRAAFCRERVCGKAMVARRKGLIVNISYWVAQKHLGNAIYRIACVGHG